MNRLIALPAALAASIAIHAQGALDATGADGFIARGIQMYLDNNYVGCIDQMTHARQIAGNEETTGYYIALSSLRRGQPDALGRLEDFIARYPQSPLRPTVQAGIGDYYYSLGRYGEAITQYDKVDPTSLTGGTLDDYLLGKSFCYLKLGEYDRADEGFAALEDSRTLGNEARFYRGYIAYCRGDYDRALTLLKRVDKRKTPGDKADCYIAQIYFARHDYDRALDMATRLLADGVGEQYRPEMLRIAGESFYHKGNDTKAISYLDQYVGETENPNPTALYILGLSQYNEGRYDDAIKTLGGVTEVDDAIAQSAYLYIGLAQLKEGDTNAALLSLDRACEMNYDPSLKETALYNYAVAKSQGGRLPFGSSVGVLEDFLKRYPSSRYAPSVREYIVNGYMTDNNYPAALAVLDKVKNPSADLLKAKQRILYILGTRDLSEGKTDLALQRLTEAADISSDRDIARECDLWIGDCLYRQREYSKAAASYRRYIAASRGAANLPLARYDLGYSLFAMRDYKQALSAFNAAIKSPGNLDKATLADAYNRVGDCLYYSNDYSGASANYDKACQLNPDAADYPMFQKAVMRGFSRDYKGKLAGLDEMMSRYPSSALVPSAMLEKAETLSALNDSRGAIDVYNRIVKEYPATAQGRSASLQLAITRLNAGNRSEAIESYRAVIREYPSSDEAKVAADDLKRIYAEDGNLDKYEQFISTIPDAPTLEASEADNLTFAAAEKAYLADTGDTGRLERYIAKYPGGANEAQALYYLASSAADSGDDNKALGYATRLISTYPDAEVAEDILAIKGAIEFKQGKGEEALKSFRSLERKASAPANLHAARLGIMRVSRDLGHNADVVAAADRMLASSAAGNSDIAEVKYMRASALNALGKSDEAVKAWEELSRNADNIYGARAAVDLGQHYYDSKQYKKAEKIVNNLIDADTPHQYWLARGFILLSDIYTAQGKKYEAREYLRSLRNNYPGDEPDIRDMIEQRLK
ncbi:MAG: tetratricopeptide repeat protein [Pseudoflavonifractor sp.]|nr:tetratricopeptide repeat protein [Pseudoflavonifractor sp.]